MGAAPQPPPAPDPAKVAGAQGEENIWAAIAQQQMNATNQNTPYGNINYQATGGMFIPTLDGRQIFAPQYSATTTLSPELQRLYNTTLGNSQISADTANVLGRSVQGQLQQNVDLGPNATEAYLNKLNTQTLDPQWEHSQTALNQQLANQGLTPGSEGWKYQQTQFGLNKSNAYNNMYLQGHDTAVQDILAQYNEPLNALNALKTGSQVYQPGIGSLAPTPQEQIQPAPYANEVNAVYGDQTSQYNAQLAAHSQEMGGLFGLGGQLIGGVGGLLSDPRDKTDVEKLGKDPKTGIEVHAYRYKSDPKSYPKVVGIMADDVEKRAPGSTFGIGGHRVIRMA